MARAGATSIPDTQIQRPRAARGAGTLPAVEVTTTSGNPPRSSRSIPIPFVLSRSARARDGGGPVHPTYRMIVITTRIERDSIADNLRDRPPFGHIRSVRCVHPKLSRRSQKFPPGGCKP
jgi:hypothetical protein